MSKKVIHRWPGGQMEQTESGSYMFAISDDGPAFYFDADEVPHIRAALDKIEGIQPPASTFARQQVDERLLSLWDSVEKMLQQTHEPANPRQGLRPVEYDDGELTYHVQPWGADTLWKSNMRKGYLIGWGQETEAPGDIYTAAIVEDAETGKVKTPAARRIRFTDVATQEEAPEPKPDAPAFKFGDRVTVLGERALIQLGPDSDGEYLVVYEGERSDYFEPSEITPGWPETETEGEGV